jgi:hypothetical protein
MAKQVEAGEDAEVGDDGEKFISKDKFIAVFNAVEVLGDKVADASGRMGDLMKKAQDKDGLDRKALSLVRQCRNMSSSRLHSFLREFDRYRDYLGLDDKAGIDMFLGTTGEANAAPKDTGKKRGRKSKAEKAAIAAAETAGAKSQPAGPVMSQTVVDAVAKAQADAMAKEDRSNVSDFPERAKSPSAA